MLGAAVGVQDTAFGILHGHDVVFVLWLSRTGIPWNGSGSVCIASLRYEEQENISLSSSSIHTLLL